MQPPFPSAIVVLSLSSHAVPEREREGEGMDGLSIVE